MNEIQLFQDYIQTTDVQNNVYKFAYDNNLDAQSYLRLRNISQKSIEDYKIGYAPETDAEFLYRNRVMLPITDVKANILGWCARAIDKEAKAKTLYTPNSLFFQKGVVVFGVAQAIDSIFSSQTAILVEGAFDAIRLHQLGYTNVLAILGTNPAPEQMSYIRMLAPKLMLMLDGDAAGRRGTQLIKEKAKNLLFDSITTIALPDNEDPDSLGNKDAQQLSNLINLAQLAN